MLRPEKNHTPKRLENIHIMGICGTGMAALAGMLKQAGYQVTGSDRQVYPPMSDFLEHIGIHPFEGYAAANLEHGPDLVIVGNVIRSDNPEAVALGQSEIPYLSFPQALAELFIQSHTSLVVCGTHGKTTTCSILASALYHAGLDPAFLIGGIVAEFQSNSRNGTGEYFVSEGDEYDTAFFDKGSKFLHYRPQIAIITSIEFDHADIFDNISQIKAAFAGFIALLPPEGLIVANLDDPIVAELTTQAPCRVEGYGMGEHNDWILKSVIPRAIVSEFTFSHGGATHSLAIPLSGKHNCLNALAVTAVLRHIGVGFDAIERCISQFGGVKRRQEVRGTVDGVTVIDDFAHHPTAVKETLNGLKGAYPDKRLIAVFEPRTNSSRRAIFQKDYAEAFGDADLVVLREPVPLDTLPAEDHFSSAKLANDLRANTLKAWSFHNTEEILNHLATTLRSGDIVAILSNGGFDNIHERLLQQMRHRAPL
ncbi:MAG: UDP-N-acetylmuramate:L-alanyl-gamma-D-glutamyl-meso-diaminopimelate ligase [Desulfopila sp.]